MRLLMLSVIVILMRIYSKRRRKAGSILKKIIAVRLVGCSTIKVPLRGRVLRKSAEKVSILIKFHTPRSTVSSASFLAIRT